MLKIMFFSKIEQPITKNEMGCQFYMNMYMYKIKPQII